MIEKYNYIGENFNSVFEFEGWKLGLIKYGDRFLTVKEMERHNQTDEVFILLDGNAILYTDDETCKMEKCVVYNVPKGTWHQITVSKDSTVLVVENSNTCKENTEKKCKSKTNRVMKKEI